ncbi:hypothetical protein A3749_00355 [Oleiphilus sp. HI0078]|uniref:aminoacyl-tRNA deacylase and HDOD domain-containing protein n=1 Tax=Oleiphilus sp. HI0132 TaxID=1822270 RepID=UPI0007C3DB10|nr:HDOD domain-containing protein [Oleiphilus sp. HI0132]KZY77337.1 hypothetical protein A3741_09855 [Oleiphilus sp. HI0069]KZZ20058.1 hypothetical protein A3749_00355 [Oleiphilus sp. HI0078]KZZ73920.1 hypothetical protein A3766_05065 [Oleiphilus sp. HI0132]
MPIASRLNQFINHKGLICQQIHHARSLSFAQALEQAQAIPEMSAVPVTLLDEEGPAVAVIPFGTKLDIELINDSLGRSFQILSDENSRKLFKDCETGMYPILATAYGLPIILDTSLLELEFVFSASGCSSTLLKIPGPSFRMAMNGAIKAKVSIWLAGEEPKSGSGQKVSNLPHNAGLTLDGIAKKLSRLYKLPPMPETAIRIMHLTSDPDADVFQLAEVIERDPSLASQVMRYARSALFSYRGELTCVKDAVNIVLGFDRVSQLSMGLAAGKAFNIPAAGPLGLKSFWQHSLYSAVLAQALALLADPDIELNERDAYLAGLLHNFGILLVGHLFPPEFQMLNKLREAEPELSMAEIEQQVFGMGGAQEFIALGHASIGAVLLKLWGMPESSITVAGMHQKKDYQGKHQKYVELVQLANALLAAKGIGDEPALHDCEKLMQGLGIQEEQGMALLDSLLEQCQSLDEMIRQMAA